MSESHPSSSIDADVQLPEPPQLPMPQTGTKFRDVILFVIAGIDDVPYGLAVKARLEAYYGSEVSNSRLYTNLDRLNDQGYVEKEAVDNRKNTYSLTEDGREYLFAKLAWQVNQLGIALDTAGSTEWSA